jgi:STELLO glycosyltransferases
MTQKLFSVLTTIQEPTRSVDDLNALLRREHASLIVVGDQKGPRNYDLEGVHFLSLQSQIESNFNLARELPLGHYTRKNIGYLLAISQGASCIYETDDDNAPAPNWQPRREIVNVVAAKPRRWVNVYSFFSTKRIWPRGFPLEELTASFNHPHAVPEEALTVRAPIQQGLANNSPDVDAIWRLVLDEAFDFQPGPSIYLPCGVWCPFNSQSTWWFPAAYPLMYLPSYCSFRMTDIWRSFIAQRCLWEMGFGLVFHGPEVVQERNAHNLMQDFTDEIPGYIRNAELVETLEGLSLAKGPDVVVDNMLACYEALVKAEFFPAKEIILISAWLDDLRKIKDAQSVK